MNKRFKITREDLNLENPTSLYKQHKDRAIKFKDLCDKRDKGQIRDFIFYGEMMSSCEDDDLVIEDSVLSPEDDKSIIHNMYLPLEMLDEESAKLATYRENKRLERNLSNRSRWYQEPKTFVDSYRSAISLITSLMEGYISIASANIEFKEIEEDKYYFSIEWEIYIDGYHWNIEHE